MATLLVNTGKKIIADAINALASNKPTYLAWGTGAGTTALTDTTLFTESTEEARTNGTPSVVTTTTTDDTYRVVGTITVVTSNKTITNAGVFTASTSGTLFIKGDFTGLPLVIGDSIQFTANAQLT